MQGINYGFWKQNPHPVEDTGTIIVTGVGRSGTSMIARILIELGLELGTHLGVNSSEDIEIRTLVKDTNLPEFEKLCRARDQRWDKWGFKCPSYRRVIPTFTPAVRNPRFIVTFRDVLAIALRNQISIGGDVLNNLQQSLNAYHHLIRQIEALTAPALLISYEKALQFPKEMVVEIAGFVGLSPRPEAVTQACAAVANGDERYLGGSGGPRARLKSFPTF